MKSTSFVALAIGLCLGGCAASKKVPATDGQASAQEGVFALDPEAKASFERVTTFRSEISVPGTDFKQAEERIITVAAKASQENGNIRLEHQYKNLTLRLSGVVNGEVSGEIDGVTLVGIISPKGELLQVEGLDTLQAALTELAGPEQAELAKQMFTAENLKLYFLGRYDTMVSDLLGHPTTPGSSWQVELGGDPLVTRRNLKVEREEPCGAASCRRVTADYGINADAVSAMAHALFSAVAVSDTGEVTPIDVVSSEFRIQDSVLVEPDTLHYHDASFVEEGRAKLSVGGQPQDIVIRRSRTMAYNYK